MQFPSADGHASSTFAWKEAMFWTSAATVESSQSRQGQTKNIV